MLRFAFFDVRITPVKKETKEPKEPKKVTKSTAPETDMPEQSAENAASADDKTLNNDGRVGTMLRETRLKKGEDLADIARKLCIRKVHLQAIEDSNYDAIPEAPYGQGFVRSYADYLGLNAVRMAQLFKEETDANTHKEDIYVLEPQAEATVPNRKYILLSLLAIAVVYGAWLFYSAPTETEEVLLQENMTVNTSVDSSKDFPLQVEEYGQGSPAGENSLDNFDDEEDEAPLTAEAPVETKAEVKDAAPAPEAKPSEPSSAPVSDTAISKDEKPAVKEETKPTLSSEDKNKETSNQAAEAPAQIPTDSDVVMKVVKEAWIEAKSPTKLYISKVVQPGFVYNVPNDEDMTISAGRIDAVEVYVKGKLVPDVFTSDKKTGISVDNLLEKADN